MATIAAAEARVQKGERAIRQREASGRPVPEAWLVAFVGAVTDLLALYEHEHAEETRRYQRHPTYRGVPGRAQAGVPVQVGLGINAGRWQA